MRSLLVVATVLHSCSVGAFVPTLLMTKPLRTAVNALPEVQRSTCTCTRKLYLEQTALVISSAFAVAKNPAFAKDALEEDKQKLVAGYKRLNYLVDNWEKETTNCKTKTEYSSASNPCERTPLKVQYYLGYRSIDDPLFRADKTMRRLEVLVPPDDTVAYLDAMEIFNEKAEEGSGMAYTSSWGEANPGGGKDRVEYFLDRARANVVDARDALGVVLKILSLN